jgi:exopolysaccharide biosynthesis polyprenyl glycosylphosphotransferase
MSTHLGALDVRTELYGVLDDRSVALLERRRRDADVRRRGWLVRRALAAADLTGLTVAFLTAMLVFGGDARADTVDNRLEVVVFLISLPGWLLVANLYGLYRSDEERADHSTADDLIGVFHVITVGSWFIFLVATLTNAADPSVQRLLAFWIGAILLVTSLRAVARTFCRRAEAYVQNTVIVGAGDVGQLVAYKLAQHPEYGLNLLGFVDAAPKTNGKGRYANGRSNGDGGLRVLGSPDRLPEIVRVLDVERVIVAFSNDSHEEILDLIRSLHGLDVQIDIVPRLFEVMGANVGIHTAEGLPLIGLAPLRLSRSALLLKRALDLAASLAGLLLLLPLFAVIAVAIKLDCRGPILFRQVRRGSNERIFRIYKFRTMAVDAEARKASLAALNKHNREGGDPRMFKIVDDPRVTRVGRVLRRYSLDELPQLLNVVKGDMSLVGPRPLILEEDQHVVDWRRRRLNLKPGITGLWQVLGRDGIPFEEMVKLDYLYVTSWSLMGDIKLILRTVPLVARPQRG